LQGLIRKNGAPYSNQTTLTEYWKVVRVAQGLEYLNVTSIVTDPVYLSGASFTGAGYTTAPIFMREADGSKWKPSPCSLKTAN
jgi:hypothetical protein